MLCSGQALWDLQLIVSQFLGGSRLELFAIDYEERPESHQDRDLMYSYGSLGNALIQIP